MGNALVLNKDFKIVMSNSMVKGKQDVLTLWQHKIFRLLISQIKPSDKGLETYTCKITDLAKYLGMKPKSMYGDINELTDKLMQAFIKINTGGIGNRESWLKINLISSCSCNNGILTIRLNDDVKPFVLQQKGFYTQYEIGSILNFKLYMPGSMRFCSPTSRQVSFQEIGTSLSTLLNSSDSLWAVRISF